MFPTETDLTEISIYTLEDLLATNVCGTSFAILDVVTVNLAVCIY